MRGDCLREQAECCLCVKTQVPFDVGQTRSGFASGNLNQINLEDLKMQFPNAKATSYNDTVVRQFAIMTIVWGVVGMLVGAEIDVLGFAIQKQFGRPRFATLFGMIFALFHLGGAMGGMISGKLHDATGGFQQPLVIAAAACVASAVIFAIMPWRKDPVA